MGQNTGASGKGKKEDDMKKETVVEEEEVEEGGQEAEHDEQDGMSVHSPCKPSSSALRKEQSQVELEIRLLEALEIYPLAKLRGIILSCSDSPKMLPHPCLILQKYTISGESDTHPLTFLNSPSNIGIHRHFVLYGLTEHLCRSFNRQFAPDDVLKLLDRFYNLDMVKPDDEDVEIINQEEEFCLPQSYFSKEEP